jgi:hypothetical protein
MSLNRLNEFKNGWRVLFSQCDVLLQHDMSYCLAP